MNRKLDILKRRSIRDFFRSSSINLLESVYSCRMNRQTRTPQPCSLSQEVRLSRTANRDTSHPVTGLPCFQFFFSRRKKMWPPKRVRVVEVDILSDFSCSWRKRQYEVLLWLTHLNETPIQFLPIPQKRPYTQKTFLQVTRKRGEGRESEFRLDLTLL